MDVSTFCPPKKPNQMDFERLVMSTKKRRHNESDSDSTLKLITDLRPWQQKVLDTFLTTADDRTINWVYDKKGGCGKTQFLKYMVHHHKVAFSRGGRYSDVCNLIFKQNMNQCKAVFLDIPREAGADVSYSALEAIKDGLISNTKYQTGSKAFNSPHVFVFSNSPPDLEKFTADRWNVIVI